MKKYDIVGIGNPLMDFITKVDDEILAEFDLKKGIAHVVEQEDIIKFSKILGHHFYSMPGGSAANTIIAASMLGLNTALMGSIGDDSLGNKYLSKLKSAGVTPLMRRVKGVTGSCMSLVTPDKERTMATFPGASMYFSKRHLNLKAIHDSGILHIEGYQLLVANEREAAINAMIEAKKSDTMVSFDFADPFLVRRHKDEIRHIVNNFADIIFANEDEARLFTGKDVSGSVKELSKKAKFVAVKLGKKGSVVASGMLVEKIPVFKVNAVDTTGAGDIYATGFLYGIAKKKPLDVCGKIASFMAAKIVAQYGAYFDYPIKKELRKLIKTSL